MMTFLAVGCYTENLPHVAGKGTGISVCAFDDVTGRLTAVHTTPGITNPSYLAFNPHHQTLYAVQESGEPETSAIKAYSVDTATGTVRFLNEQSAQGAAPCHIHVEGSGQFLFGANYVSGNFVVFALAADGRIRPATHIITHPGLQPHAHMMVTDPTNQFVLAVDLGLNKVFTYRLDDTVGIYALHAETMMPANSGPRHLVFHPHGRTLFVIHEHSSQVTTWAFADGRLTHLHTVSTLPEGCTGPNAPAAIRVSADGRFVYASNRGHDTVAVFAFDESINELKLLAHIPTNGRTPRDFVLDPTGNFLLVANQDSGTIIVFRLNPQTGLPTSIAHTFEIPTPVCLQILT